MSADKQECKHEKVMPAFDIEAAKDLPAREVRQRWPRFSGLCPDCGYEGILYASFEQYIMGDY